MSKEYKMASDGKEGFWNTYGATVPPHDDKACKALLEYERECRSYEKHLPPGKPYPHARTLMCEMANKYGTDITEMKKHWRCVERIIGRGEDK